MTSVLLCHVSLLGSLTAAMTTLRGCGATHIYRLRAPAAGAESTFTPIAKCTRGQGFAVSKLDDAVHVKVAHDAWVYFNTDVHGGLQMLLHFIGAAENAKPSDPTARDACRKTDGIWACVRSVPFSAPTLATTPTSTTPPPMPPRAITRPPRPSRHS